MHREAEAGSGFMEFGFLTDGELRGWFIDGSFLLGLLAGEVLFAEVLVTPTGVSKGCGCVTFIMDE